MMKPMRNIAALLLLALLALTPAAALGQQIRGLDALDALPAGQTLPARSGKVALTLSGAPLPYDEAMGAYLVPQDPGTKGFDGEIRIEEEDGFTYYVQAPEGFDKASALADGLRLTVVGVSEEECVSSDVIFTALPVILLTTQTGEMPAEEDGVGHIALYTAEKGRLTVEESSIEINLRGNTSTWLPKKSYRVKITDEDGVKQDLQIGSLRADDDWIFNPMYADTSKIREALAYRLWEEVNTSGQKAESSRMTYAEVFFHGEYWGLYGVQERIDRKQVDADRRVGILYKVLTNERPTPQTLLACEDPACCEGFEVKFAGEHVSDPWTPAAAYMAFLDGGEPVEGAGLSMKNVIDYGLWAMFVQAHDCHFKNQFLHAVYTGEDGYTMYKIPWDLNHTFGDMWDGENEAANYTRYCLNRLVMDGAFEQLIAVGDESVYRAIQARYAQLREGLFTEDAVMRRAQALREPLGAAMARDTARWPECGMGDGNEDNLRDIAISVRTLLPLMDEFIAVLGEETTPQEPTYETALEAM